jgi:hypothetical protein
MIVNENKLETTPSGGALVGKRNGQTMIHNKGSMSGYLVGKTHAEGGIKAINKSTGQPLEMQGGEVVITAPAVSDQTKRKFEGKMMTNREILSAINEKGGGISFAQGGELPSEMHFSGASYKYGGKMLSDHDIAYELSQCGCEHEMKKGGGVRTTKVVTYKDKYNRKYNYPKNTSHTLKEISKDTNVSMKGLRQIYNKGIGAYKTNPSSVRPNVKSKEQWAMARVYSAVMGGKASKVDSNELKMNVGGGVRKDSLVKDSKSGNTPARDLNNYNDMMDVGVDGEVGGENGLAFLKGGEIENVEILNWDDVPTEFKKRSKVKKVPFTNDPMDKGLYDIIMPFLSYNDLRPALMGVIFDENGISATDAHLLITLPYPNKKYEGVYDLKWAIKNKADKPILMNYPYPNYKQIIPYSYQYGATPYEVSTYKLLEYTKSALKYSNKEIQGISYKFGDNESIGFNGKLLVKILTTALKLGHEKLYAYISTPNKVVVLTPSKNYEFGKDELLLIMPIMLQSQYVNLNSYGTEDEDFKRSLKVYYDFNDDEIHNADGSVADFDMNSKKNTSVQKQISPLQKADDFSFLDNIDNVFFEGGTVGNENVLSIKIRNARSYYESDLVGKEYYSFSEFKVGLKEAFIKNGEAEGWISFIINSVRSIMIDFKKAKNTVKNFNPLTGTADDFEKVCLRADKYNYKKYDWNYWYLGLGATNVSTPSVPQQKQTNNIFTPSEILEIDRLGETNFGINNSTIINLPSIIRKLVRLREFEQKGKTDSTYLSLAFSWSDSPEGSDFWNDISIGKFKEFKKRYGSGASASTASAPQLTFKDLAESQIWIGDNPELLKVVQEKAFALGFKWAGDSKGKPQIQLGANNLRFWDDGDITVRQLKTKDEFDNTILKKITPVELGIDVNNLSASVSSASAPNITSKNIFNNIKIKTNFDNNLTLKIIEKLEEFGFNRVQSLKRKMEKEPIYAIFTSEEDYIGWIVDDKEFDEHYDYKEIFPADLGIDVNNLGGTQQMPIDLTTIPKSRAKVLFEIKKFVDDNNLTPNPAVLDALSNIKTFKDEETGQIFNFTFDNTLLNPFSVSSSDLLFQFLDFEKGFNDFANKKINELSDGIANVYQLAVEEVLSFEKEQKEINALTKLLPAFQDSKFAPQKAMILKEIGRLHKKITYEGFISQNEKNSKGNQLFTPQGLLKYYHSQTTQSPVSPLEPACELPTPNGAKSKLPLSTYFNVRTSRFKKWFGDWEKAYETNNYVDCSKMIDEETKEPKIFYHGVRKYVPNFGQFSNMGQGVVRPYGSFEPPTAFPASYFSDSIDYAKFYGGEAPNMPKPSPDYEPFIYKVFLSAKNPINLLPLGFESSYKDMIDYLLIAFGVRVQPSRSVLDRIQNNMKAKHPVWVYVRNDIGLLETLKEYGYDSLIQTGDIPTFDENGSVIDDRSKFIQDEEYLTFYPTQVKSATVKKSFYFDFFKDIRFKQGGYVRI